VTFLQAQQNLARRLNKTAGTLVTDTGTRFKDRLNERHRELLRMPGMGSLRWGNIAVASVASQQGYAVPMQGVARIDRGYDPSNRIKLTRKDLSWFREVDPNPMTGQPEYIVETGNVQVHTQPSDASEVFVKSTSASDTTQTCYVEGFITGGYRRTASVTLTGATAVSLASTITNWILVDKVYLSAAGAGIVTLHEDSGAGTELSRIAIGDTWGSFLSFLLYPTPSAVVTYRLDITRTIPTLTNDTDEFWIHEDFHDVVIDGAEMDELVKSDDASRFQMVRDRWMQGKKDLKTWVQDHPDWRPVMTGGHLGRRPVEQNWLVS
jgi:hypothetical protein